MCIRDSLELRVDGGDGLVNKAHQFLHLGLEVGVRGHALALDLLALVLQGLPQLVQLGAVLLGTLDAVLCYHQAGVQRQALRKLAGVINRTNTIAIFINQLREKVGVVYGNPEVTPGGRALKFYSSVRLDVRKKEVLKSGTDIIGSRTKVKVVKNKVAPPFREVEFDIMYGQGISKVGDLLDLAERLEIVQKSGAWFSYNGTRIGQGRDNAKNFLRDNPDIFEEISELVRQNADKLYAKSIKGGSAPKPVEKAEEEESPEQAENTRKNVQADIDITVDDDE